MKHFTATTLEEVKKEYRNLAKIHHPDKGGDAEVMKEVNAEYDFLCARILKGENLTSEDFDSKWETSQQFKEKVGAIINLAGIVIEIVGEWVWITGQTYAVRNELKAAGYWFASKKVAWFWRPEHAAGGRGKKSLDEIRAKYGSERVNGSNFKSHKLIHA